MIKGVALMNVLVLICLSIGVLAPICASPQVLLISNNPEKISEPGLILNQTIRTGAVRYMYYHQNVASTNLYIRTTIKNASSTPHVIRLLYGLAGPSSDGLHVGHIATKRFFNELKNNKLSYVTLAPGEVSQISTQLIKPMQVSTGIVHASSVSGKQFAIKSEVVADKASYLSELNVVSSQSAYTYGYYKDSTVTKTVVFNTTDTLKEIPIGKAPFLLDATTNEPLQGNYGVFYNIKLSLVNNSLGNKKIDLLFAPLAGFSRLVFLLNNKLIETETTPESLMKTPEIVQSFSVGPKETKHFNLLLLPQPGAFYPVNLVLKATHSI